MKCLQGEQTALSTIASLFFLGTGAGLILPAHMKTVYFPCLLTPGMEGKALSCGIAMFFLGMWGASLIPRREKTYFLVHRASAFLSVLLLGGAGIHLCSGTPFELNLLIPVPILVGLAVGLELQKASGNGHAAAGVTALTAGAACGSLFHPFAFYQVLGAGPSLQVQAIVLLAAGLCVSRPRFPSSHVDDVSPRENLAAFVHTLYFLVLLLLLEDRLRHACLFDLHVGGWVAGFALAGLTLALLLRDLFLPGVSPGFCLLIWISVSIPFLDTVHSSSQVQDLKWTALACVPFGFIAGLTVNRSLIAASTSKAAALAAGIVPAFLIAERVLYHSAGSARLAVLAGLLLVLVECIRRRGKRSISFLFVGVGLACMALSLLLCREVWIPGTSEEVVRIRGPNVDLSCSLNDEGSDGAITVFGTDPFDGADGPAQRERMANLSSFFHPRPGQVLVLGADTGTFVNTVARDPVVKSAVWVNPCQEFADLARMLHGSFPGLGVETVLMPERLYSRQAAGPFDLILVPPSPLARVRHAGLDTVEFYREARRLLSRGGMLCQWIFIHQTDPDGFAAQVASLSRVFPRLYLFVDHPFARCPAVALVGSNTEIRIPESHLQNRMKAAGRLEFFQRIGLCPETFGLGFISSKEAVDAKLPGFIRKDGRAPVLFLCPESARFFLGTNLRFLLSVKVSSFPLFPGEPTFDEELKRSRLVHRAGSIMLHGAERSLPGRWAGKSLDLTRGEELTLRDALILTTALRPIPDNPYLLRLLTEKARSLKQANRMSDCMMLYETCLGHAPGHGDFRLDLAALHAEHGRYDQAYGLLREAHWKNREDRRFPIVLAVLEARQGRWREAGIILGILLQSSMPGDPYLPWIVAVMDLLHGRVPRMPRGEPCDEEMWISSIVQEFILDYRGS